MLYFSTKKLHTFGIKPSPLCSFCYLFDKTPLHIFYECDSVKGLCANLVQCFQNKLVLPTLTLHADILKILESASNDSTSKNKVFISHILLIFKLHLFKSREKKFINLNKLIAEVWKVKTIEKRNRFN